MELPAQTDGLRLGEALRGLESRGFRAQLHAAPEGRVACEACQAASPASLVEVLVQARLEGVSDPADETLLAGVRCPECQALGTLVLAYGPRAGREEAAVLAALPPPRRGTPSLRSA